MPHDGEEAIRADTITRQDLQQAPLAAHGPANASPSRPPAAVICLNTDADVDASANDAAVGGQDGISTTARRKPARIHQRLLFYSGDIEESRAASAKYLQSRRAACIAFYRRNRLSIKICGALLGLLFFCAISAVLALNVYVPWYIQDQFAHFPTDSGWPPTNFTRLEPRRILFSSYKVFGFSNFVDTEIEFAAPIDFYTDGTVIPPGVVEGSDSDERRRAQDDAASPHGSPINVTGNEVTNGFENLVTSLPYFPTMRFGRYDRFVMDHSFTMNIVNRLEWEYLWRRWISMAMAREPPVPSDDNSTVTAAPDSPAALGNSDTALRDVVTARSFNDSGPANANASSSNSSSSAPIGGGGGTGGVNAQNETMWRVVTKVNVRMLGFEWRNVRLEKFMPWSGGMTNQEDSPLALKVRKWDLHGDSSMPSLRLDLQYNNTGLVGVDLGGIQFDVSTRYKVNDTSEPYVHLLDVQFPDFQYLPGTSNITIDNNFLMKNVNSVKATWQIFTNYLYNDTSHIAIRNIRRLRNESDPLLIAQGGASWFDNVMASLSFNIQLSRTEPVSHLLADRFKKMIGMDDGDKSKSINSTAAESATAKHAASDE